MKRRTFLNTTAAAAAGSIVAPYITKGRLLKIIPNDKLQSFDDDSIMVIIELFGGNDGLNTIVPAYNDTYYKIRPTLAYPKTMLKQYQNTDLYFNPSLVDGAHNGGMLQMFADGRLAVIEGIGYSNPNLSHFRSQDIWLSGINNSDNSVKLTEGWLGRFIADKLPNFPEEVPEHPIAIQLDGTLSLLFKSNKGDMGIALTDPDSFYELGKGITPVESLLPGSNNFEKEFNFAYVIAKQSELYSKAVKDAWDKGKDKLKVQYSSGLSEKFKLMSGLIAGGLKTKIFYMSLSNFDSHAQQMDSGFGGQHPTLLNQVAKGISEFMDDAVQQGFAKRIAGMTISEFGRRAYDNGSRGTDHGAASMQFVFGHDDYVNGAYYRIDGKPDLDNLDEDGNIVYQFDYRRTFVDFLQTWLGATEAETEKIFGQKFQPIGVLSPRSSSVENLVAKNNGDYLSVYPDPSFGNFTVSFELKQRSQVRLDVCDLRGFPVLGIINGYLEPGYYSYPANMQYASGIYICSLSVNGKNYSKNLSIIR